MVGFLLPVIRVVIAAIDIYWYVLIATVVVSWLIAFGIINTYNRTVAMVSDILYRVTEPVLRPIRRFLPNFGGLDISPLILMLILWFIEMELYQLAFSLRQWAY